MNWIKERFMISDIVILFIAFCIFSGFNSGLAFAQIFWFGLGYCGGRLIMIKLGITKLRSERGYW